MERYIRFALRKALPFVLLAALTVYLFIYATKSITVPVADNIPPQADEEAVLPQQPAIKEPPKSIEAPAPDTESVLSRLSANATESLKNGFVITDTVFDASTHMLSKVPVADASIMPPHAFYSVEYVLEEGTALYIDYTLRPRMGYLSLADSTKSLILDANGKLVTIPDELHLSFAASRDKNGSPVFVDYVTGEYYILSDGTFIPSDYNPVTDFRGINFDYPSYYGVSDNPDCKVISSARGMGYRIGERNAVNTAYTRAFAFSEGYGCAYDAKNRLYFFNENGKLALGGIGDTVFYGCGSDAGDSSLGYYYFDEGLTRITVKETAADITTERDILIDTHGKEFPLPSDFTLKAYSCGRILLEKDGICGYMASDGTWTSDPEFTFARPYFEGLAVVEKDGKKGVIDKNGNFVIAPVFDEITDCSGGIICAYESTNGWHIIHKTAAPPPETTPEQPKENKPDAEQTEITADNIIAAE